MKAFPTKRLKYAVRLRSTRVEGSSDDRPYIGMENIESQTGRLITPNGTEDNAVSSTSAGDSLYSTFEPNDVLFGKLRPYLAKAWVAEFPGRSTTEFLPLTPMGFEPRFLQAVCLSPGFVDAVNASTFGSKMPRADWDFIGNMPVPVPPLSTQRAIADYLDRETSRIDALLSAKERWLEILAEKRTAVITNAVTRGLNPKAPLRDSGIPWLGQIPKQWEIKRSKWLFTERDERSTTGEEVLLSLRMEKGLVPHNDVSNKPTSPAELIGYKKTSVGEIVINRMRASSGLIALTPQDGLVSPDYAVYCPDKNIDPLYYTYLFTTELLQKIFRSESTGLGTGSSGFLRLYSEKFLSFWFPVPPIDEQQRIVDHIAKETTKIDKLRTATEKTIALLKERRSALISAAVTGTITVEEMCA